MYKCTACGELFYSTVDCASHQEAQHPEAEALDCIQVQYRCEVCAQIFGHRADVKNHALRDHGLQRPRVMELETARA
jgi:uncharacterized C2H2 Zn-finger protein